MRRLLLDNREQFSGGLRTEAVDRLTRAGVRCASCALEVGDALWVARPKIMCGATAGPETDYALDFIIERKRVDDLVSSIKDARYVAQKYFLKRSGVSRLVYLVQGDTAAMCSADSIGDAMRVKTAAAQTEVHDGFRVLRARDERDTFARYADISRALGALYGPMTATHASPDVAPTVGAFNRAVRHVKRSQHTIRVVWGAMLMQVAGVGADAAHAIVASYPTPSSLFVAYGNVSNAANKAAMLAPLRKSAASTVGLAVSARVYASFFERPM